MIYYRLGRILQVLALIDCGIALFFADFFPSFSGMDAQLQIVIFAGALFAAGRVFQNMGESKLRAAGVVLRTQNLENSVSDSSMGSPQGGPNKTEGR